MPPGQRAGDGRRGLRGGVHDGDVVDVHAGDGVGGGAPLRNDEANDRDRVRDARVVGPGDGGDEAMIAREVERDARGRVGAWELVQAVDAGGVPGAQPEGRVETRRVDADPDADGLRLTRQDQALTTRW